ncbi:Crp/Fnr family transcriptional regulator [Brevibacillus reuszeri]|uniref:Crp/Fnr family transcriptional regulator n=1 Tax=Brevibacillus reuszeri TaxID=54915 RepID=UPI003D25552C
MDKSKFLSRIDLFQKLSTEELMQIEPIAPMNTIKKGTIIASPQHGGKLLYLVKSGMVRLYKLSEGGKELTVDLLRVGHIFGEIGSFTISSENMYAEAWEDCVICTINKPQFEQLMREKPELALHFIEIISTRLKEVEEMMEHMAYGSVRKRLLYLLHKLSEKFGSGFSMGENEDTDRKWIELEVKLTHQELASIMGSIRETVTEQLTELAAEGIVSKEGQRKPLRVHPERLKMAWDACR